MDRQAERMWSNAVPIDIVARPVATVGGGVSDPSVPTELFVLSEPGAAVHAAECVSYPDVPRSLDSCRPLSDLTLSATGSGQATIDVQPTVSVGDTAYDCTRYPCVVTVFDDAGGVVGSADISGSLAGVVLTVEPNDELSPGQQVTVTRTLNDVPRLGAGVPRLGTRRQRGAVHGV